jgi:protein ImuB
LQSPVRKGRASPRPETAIVLHPFDGLRPVRLLPVPEPVEATFAVPDGVPLNFRWRRALHVVRKFEGPERIAPEWWRGEAERTRDYFRIEDADGRRYWLFRKGFHGEVVDPAIPVPPVAAWYLHGIFA